MGILDRLRGKKKTQTKRERAIRDSFVVSCFDFDFREEDDNRHWKEMKDLSEIYWKEMKEVYSGNTGICSKAIISLETALEKYPDYDVLYSWLGFCKRVLNGAKEARKIYLKGLKKSRTKAPLCGALGMLAFEENNLSEAVKWWIRSCAIQTVGKRYTNGFSFLNIATIAKYLGLKDCYSKLLEQSKKIQNVIFDASGERQRASIVQKQGNNSIKQAIEILCKDYF